MFVLFVTYFFVLRKNVRNYHIIIICLVSAAFIINAFFSKTLIVTVPHLYRYVYRIIIYMSFVYVGYLVWFLMERIDNTILLVVSVLFAIFCIVLYLFFPSFMEIYNFSTLNEGNPFSLYFMPIPNSLWVIIICKKIKITRIFDFWGKNTLIIMFLHMDITVEIGYMVVGKIPFGLNESLISILVIIIEFVMLFIIILFTNKYCVWLVKYPFGVRKKF